MMFSRKAIIMRTVLERTLSCWKNSVGRLGIFLPRLSKFLNLNPIEHVFDELGRAVYLMCVDRREVR